MARVHPASLPLVVGVTGHRDIPAEDYGALAEAVRNELTRLRDRFGSTPIVAMSSLAEGADRLFARVAIELGIPLEVPLPLAQGDYERDFAAPGQASLDEFRDLLAKAAAVFTVPRVEAIEHLATHPNVWRELRYAQAGFYISQRCHVLFALWDGKPAAGLGGTGQIVSVRTTGRIAPSRDPAIDAGLREVSGVSTLAEPDMSAVRWIPVRRGTSSEPPAGGPAWFPDAPRGQGGHEDRLDAVQRLDAYNAELCSSARSLVQPAAKAGLAQTELRLAEADRLASSQTTHLRRHVRTLFLLAFGVVLAHALYSEIWKHWPALVGYLAGLAVVTLLAWSLRKRELNPQSVDLRALAEGLRIQRAWQLAGLHDAVAQHYLRRDAEHLRWVRQALVGTALAPCTGERDLPRVQTEWVEDQRDYFRRSVVRRHASIERAARWSGLLLVGGVLAVSCLLLEHFLAVFPGGEEGLWLRLIAAAVGVLPAAAGLVSGYVEFAGMEEDVREHRRMLQMFDRAARALAGATEEEQQRVMFELGVEALHENARWAVTHKARDPKAPGG